MEFSQTGGYTATIKEDGQSLTTLAVSATLTDPNITDNISYAFVTDANTGATDTTHQGFTIDAAHGTITFTGTASTDLDFESITKNPIALSVRATHDNGDTAIPNPFGDVEVEISVTDLNDEKPVLLGGAGVSIDEMTATGGDFATGYTFTLTDADAVDTLANFMAGDFGFNDMRFGSKNRHSWHMGIGAERWRDARLRNTADQSIALKSQ